MTVFVVDFGHHRGDLDRDCGRGRVGGDGIFEEDAGFTLFVKNGIDGLGKVVISCGWSGGRTPDDKLVSVVDQFVSGVSIKRSQSVIGGCGR